MKTIVLQTSLKRTARAVLDALRDYSFGEALSDQLMIASWEHACEGAPPPLPTWRYYAPALRDLAGHRTRRVICAVRGHIVADAGSYANPESAEDEFCCRRCGENWHHTYY